MDAGDDGDPSEAQGDGEEEWGTGWRFFKVEDVIETWCCVWSTLCSVGE